MKVTHVVFDCNDLDVVARFWGALLKLETTQRDDGWLDLEPLGKDGPVLSFQLVPEGKAVKNRVHLDLDVPDIAVAGERARALGATPASEPMGENPERPFQVWYDPEGNEFCFCTE
ncbi:VOC family protein [Actinomadura rayongensis]|uniref:VOC family protein n=1 Tax=Actinomadura rayongensis TaxID=1429076 RepID=A0A6I4W2C2_9ACTN|nr:VOC family protein [Actinomadura rayongensis]MXQ63623.1 VOC family protein [Actinomadura rayongensis]